MLGGIPAHFRLTPDEPVNYDKIIEMVVLEDRMMLIQRSQESFATNKPFRVEYRIINRLGQVRWVETRAKALLGKTPALLGIVIDVTERKKSRQIRRWLRAKYRTASRTQWLWCNR